MINIIVNGYGIPKDIFSDQSYHSYLGQIFNFLWDNYKNKKLNIIFCGGNTDMRPPYRRTEAGEIYKWFEPRIREHKLSKNWKLRKNTSSLSALENLLTSKKLLDKGRVIYFCEKTRQDKSQRLSKEIFGQRVKVIAIDFDVSPARYTKLRQELESEDLKYSLRALRDRKFRNLLKKANHEKIKRLRALSASRRELMVDKIAIEIRRKYFN